MNTELFDCRIDMNWLAHRPRVLKTSLTLLLVILGPPSSVQSQDAPAEMNPPATPAADSIIAIVGGRLIDGNGDEPIDNACVIVRGNKIVGVGARSDVDLPDGATVIDVTGKSVLPGLFDSHFHSIDTLVTPVEYELNRGITSFRDPGHPFKYYKRLLASDETLPRVFLCGGHLDAEPVVWPDQAIRIASQADAHAAVNDHIDRGASAIKIYFRLPLDHVRAACEAASGRGVPVTAHLELVRADDAIRAGVNGIEHITSFGTTLATPTLASQFAEVVSADSSARTKWRYRLWQQTDIDDNPRVKPLLDLIVREGVYVSPTLAIFESRVGDKNVTPEKVDGFVNMMDFFRRCHEAGAKIVVGSHTWAPNAAKGRAYLREMQLMAESGMTPLAIITAATKTNAGFFGVSDRLGTIEAGKLADLIIVDGDPSKSIDQIDRIERVMLNGNWVTTPASPVNADQP